MRNGIITRIVFLSLFILFINSSATFSEIKMPTIISFKGASDYARKPGGDFYPVNSGPIRFSHTRHHDEYGLGCGRCHHDDEGVPIKNMSPADAVGCIECHMEQGYLHGMRWDRMGREERLEYRVEAMHMLCKNCHLDLVKEKKALPAPVSCRTCHTSLSQK